MRKGQQPISVRTYYQTHAQNINECKTLHLLTEAGKTTGAKGHTAYMRGKNTEEKHENALYKSKASNGILIQERALNGS